MLKLYGSARSRASRNLWLLGELGVAFEHIRVIQAYRLPDPLAPDAPLNTRSPGFLAMSAAGAVPVLDDDGLVMSESMAINHYLARKYGGPLAPADAREEAQMLQWSFYAATAIESDALKVLNIAGPKAQGWDENMELGEAAGRLARPVAVVEALLTAESHPVGGRFTIADIALAEVLRYAQALPSIFEGYPATRAWLHACHQRPAFKAMMEKRNAEPT